MVTARLARAGLVVTARATWKGCQPRRAASYDREEAVVMRPPAFPVADHAASAWPAPGFAQADLEEHQQHGAAQPE